MPVLCLQLVVVCLCCVCSQWFCGCVVPVVSGFVAALCLQSVVLCLCSVVLWLCCAFGQLFCGCVMPVDSGFVAVLCL